MSKIKKLGISLKQRTKEDYEKAKAQYISDYKEYEAGGFLVSGSYKNMPEIGLAKWNAFYPMGYKDWVAVGGAKLTSYGQQQLIDKINELVAVVNAQGVRGDTSVRPNDKPISELGQAAKPAPRGNKDDV